MCVCVCMYIKYLENFVVNVSDKIYSSQLYQFRAKAQYCKKSLKEQVSSKGVRCEVLKMVLVKDKAFQKITSFPAVNRY
jgi:hypothetical protein